MFASFASAGEPASVYRVVERNGRHEAWFDEECIAVSGRADEPVAMLLWHINRQVIERSGRFVRLHAAVASRAGVAVVLPGHMEAGKTTLVTGLVRRGLAYLSDELAALEPDSLTVHAYPKPLSLDEGSWELFPELAPAVDPSVGRRLPHQWQAPATRIRPDAIERTARPGWIVFPRYEPGAPTELTPLSRVDTLMALIEASFEFAEHPGRDLDALTRLAAQCPGHRLRVGDLEGACEAVLGVLDAPIPPHVRDGAR